MLLKGLVLKRIRPFLIAFIKKFINLFMTKAECLQAVTAEGSIGRFSRSPAWEKAFNAYNQATGDNLKPSCGSCFRKVLKWMQS